LSLAFVGDEAALKTKILLEIHFVRKYRNNVSKKNERNLRKRDGINTENKQISITVSQKPTKWKVSFEWACLEAH